MSKHSSVVHGIVTLALVTLLFALPASAQPAMPVPQPSPKAVVSQTIGITDVVISYHRPSVNNRKVWGDLVPFDQVWRAGANENTTISFSTPVKIEGKEVAAGTYGLHMIPTQTAWTVILSKNSTSWGSFFYNQDEDALRVTVSPQAADMQEMLKYEFDNVTRNSATIDLRWEKLLVSVKIEVDTKANVLANARDTYFRGLAGFTWQGFNQAAAYCLQNNTNLDDALTWSDKSIAIAENVNNLFIKGSILEKLGRSQEAAAVENRIAKIAMSEADVNLLGYLYLGAAKKKEAIEVFKKNVKQHPDSWNAYDSLGEGYASNGDVKLAIESYTKALNMVKDDANRTRIKGILDKLASK